MCLTTGNFPNCLKKAGILPLFKKGDRNNISNYRPISILPTLSKIIEKCIETRLLHYSSIYNIINPSQFGFQSGISSQDAIIYLTEKLYNNLNNFSSSIGIYIDFSKAFDTVNRSILLKET